MGDYDYCDYKYEDLEAMDTEKLCKIIEIIWGPEETSAALLILQYRNPSKALEYGIDILVNDKGDDYLQATVWDYFFDDNKETILEAINKREAPIGKVLLNDMMRDIASLKVDISDEMVNRMLETFDMLSVEEKELLLKLGIQDTDEFLKIYRDN